MATTKAIASNSALIGSTRHIKHIATIRTILNILLSNILNTLYGTTATATSLGSWNWTSCNYIGIVPERGRSRDREAEKEK